VLIVSVLASDGYNARMADFLECLVQIKALRETAPRLRALVRDTVADRWRVRPAEGVWSPVEVLAHLADAELFFGTRIRLILTSDHPHLEPYDQEALAQRAGYCDWPLETALARFETRRDETLELLASCSAAELARVGLHQQRGELSLDTLVAIMLAHDTGHVGQIRIRLGFPASAANESK
jgi:uncharacterized damage-inducible protein DinB